VNEGIGGNRVLHDGMGLNSLARFDRDVLSNPGVSSIIFLEGINDLGWPHMKPPKNLDPEVAKKFDMAAQDVTAEELIGGIKQIIERAHEHGIKVFGATILPFEGADYYSQPGEEKREAVNEWIRTSHAFDGVVDLEAAVRDPSQPKRILEAYQIGDHLHPNDAGYKVMADAISLAILRGGNK
jgi:lysophospholipase L1-like esterase